MSIRFAPARHRDALSRTVAWGAKSFGNIRAANDNAASAEYPALLTETLRHFAAYGLSSAARARTMALGAAMAGDNDGYDHWASIYQMLDKRKAKTLAAEAFATSTEHA